MFIFVYKPDAMKQVSKEQYDSAVIVIQDYYRQVEKSIQKNGRKSNLKIKKKALHDNPPVLRRAKVKRGFNLDQIRTGDYLLAVKTNSLYITVGQEYKVLDGNGSAIKVQDNAGTIKAISRQNKFGLWMCTA